MQTSLRAQPPGDNLLLHLYGCCGQPARWREILDRLCSELDAHSAVVQGLRIEGHRAATIWLAHDSHIDMAAYEASVSDRGNARLESNRFVSAAGRIVDDADLFSPDEVSLRSRLQKDLAALGLGRFLGGVLPVGPGRYVSIALHRRTSDARAYSPRQRDRLAALLPHIAQAVQLSEVIVRNALAGSLLQGPLERWPFGLLVCDSDARVLWANRRVTMTLSIGRGLCIVQGRLQAGNLLTQQNLLHALRAQAKEPSFLALESQGHTWRLAIHPLSSGPGQVTSPLFLISMSDDRPTSDIPVAALIELFGLTHAESRLTSALVAGHTLEHFAHQRGVSVGTARYQLRQVLAKTGTERQADLVRAVLCSAAAYASSSESFCVR